MPDDTRETPMPDDVKMALLGERLKEVRKDLDDHEGYHRDVLGPDRHRTNNRLTTLELSLKKDDRDGSLRRIDEVEDRLSSMESKMQVISVRFMLLWGLLVGATGVLLEMGIRWLITGTVK